MNSATSLREGGEGLDVAAQEALERLVEGEGLLQRVAFVVAGARFELWRRPPLAFDFLLRY